MKKVSIIIPCYNAIDFIETCLNSLENQTSQDFEVIIIDDASVDKSYEKLLEMKEKINFQLKIIKNEKNLGAGETRNRGISEAKGEYIMFLDCDDYIEKHTIEHIIEKIKKYNLDCLLFDYYIVKNQMKIKYKTVKATDYGLINKRTALIHSTGSTWCKVYKKNIVIENKIKFLDIKRNEDMPFNKLAISFCEKIYYLNEALYYYVQNESSLMHNDDLKNKENAIKAFEYVNEVLKGKFDYELEAIFIKEYLYSSVFTMIQKREKNKVIKNHIENCLIKFPTWYRNSEIRKFNLYQRLSLFFIRKKMIFVLKLLVNIKKSVIKISR